MKTSNRSIQRRKFGRARAGALFAVSLSVAFAFSTQAEPPTASTSVETSSIDAAELAKKLSNPIAALISVPLQNNWDFGGGPTGDGMQYKLNIQPVIPISISEDWNMISRTILPYIYQEDIIGSSSQSGLGDTVQSAFFSPKDPGSNGIVWGLGPVLLFPTATEDLLGSEKWGAGPTIVVLKQIGGLTVGGLANHIWSFAGDSDRAAVNATYIQPFLSYTTHTATSLTINTESTYDWEHGQWTVPINAGVGQVIKIGSQRLQFTLMGRYYADAPENGPEWGLRFQVTFLFPK